MNQIRYTEKFERGSSHDLLRNWFRGHPAGLRVLDIGTAGGTLGKMLSEMGMNLYGVEPHRQWAELAKPFYQDIFVGSLEETDDHFLSGFDVVVCADVLEHLPDPQVQLSRLTQLQKTGTIFLVCVPNVANLWVRLQLLFGKFEYTERGILDRTHLRFFTQSSLLDLLTNSGLEVQKIIPTPIPVSLIVPIFFRSFIGSILQRCLYQFTKWFSRLLGYQFFAICRRCD